MKSLIMKSSAQKILKAFLKKKVSSTETRSESDDRIKFFRKLTKLEKAFRLFATIILETIRIMLEKVYTQADQSSEMNVISFEMIRKLSLARHALTNIELADFIMKTTDHKKTRFHSWIEFTLEVKNIIRIIKCFIDSESHDLFENIVNQYRLLLNLSWLYSVNVVINIRSSSIQIENTTFHEIVRTVTESKFVFSENHNLLMYSKFEFSRNLESKKKVKSHEKKSEENDDFDDEFDDFENNLFDIEEVSVQQNFR